MSSKNTSRADDLGLVGVDFALRGVSVAEVETHGCKCRLSGACFKKEAAPSPEGAGLIRACCIFPLYRPGNLIARTQLRSLNRHSWVPAPPH